MNKHTNGRWHYENYAPGAGFGIYAAEEGGEVPVVWHSGGVRDEADARLIAAAPDLLMALKALVVMVAPLVAAAGLGERQAELHAALDGAGRAVAKAEGREDAP